MASARAREETEGWFHDLKNGRMEIFLKLADADGETVAKIRATGPAEEMGELIDWFERTTGKSVEVPQTQWRRMRRGPKPDSGQGNLFETAQLSSQDATVPDDGE